MPYTLNSKEEISNLPNQSENFQKSVNPQNNANSNENSKSQSKQSKLNSKILPSNQQTPNTLQQIIKIMQDIMKPETIKEILKSLKIITTTINQTIKATTGT